jgi:hypothetical protein
MARLLVIELVDEVDYLFNSQIAVLAICESVFLFWFRF